MYGQYVLTLWYRISRSSSLYRETNARVLTRAVSWLTNSCQLLIISWRGNIVSCGGANDPAIFLILVSLIVLRLVWYGVRIFFPATLWSTTTLRAHREVFCNSLRIKPSLPTVPVPMVAGPKVPAALSLPFFSYFCVILLVMCYYCCVPHEYLRN